MLFFGIAKEWEQHAVFTLGRLSRIVGPGLYFYMPFIQSIYYRIDTRIITYTVPLQKGLTRDNIPVQVDAIVFYQVVDCRAAITKVDNFHKATQLSARSAIRDMVGKSQLDELLAERDKIGKVLSSHIAGFTSQWGVTVISVEVKDVIVATELEDAIAREAAAEREKRARIKLAEAEDLAAKSMVQASEQYKGNDTAMQLRSMNMLYEMCMEGKSTMVFVPTERTAGGMPGVIGVQSINEMLRSDKRADTDSIDGEERS